MKRMTVALALLFGAQTAQAQSWADFESAFPVFPCQDGWMACLVDGEAVNPELQQEPSGLQVSADLRIGWFDLNATSNFSPFVDLSEYTGELPDAAVADIDDGDDGSDMIEEEDPDEVPEDYVPSEESVAAAEAAEEANAAQAAAAAETRAAEEEAQRQRDAAAAAAAEKAEQEQKARAAEEAAKNAANEEERKRLQAEAAAAAKAAKDAEAARKAAEAEAKRQEEERMAKQKAEEAAAKKAEEQRLAAEAAAAAEAERLAKAKAEDEERKRKEAEEAATAKAAADAEAAANDAVADAADAEEPGGVRPSEPADCSLGNLVKLEPPAMLGKMSDSQTGACEETLASTPKMTDKGKISRLLMVNAFSKGDKATWEGLVKRHLDEIDQSDPDLCYKYALHLSRKGVGRSSGVIRWADVALENRIVWTGDTYTSRVYSLYKLRAAAAQKLWADAEKKHAESPTEKTKGKIDKYRAMTKVMAREWYEYAKVASKDTTKALQLCMSAAGTKDYCEAG